MCNPNAWVTGPALRTVIELKAIQPGDMVRVTNLRASHLNVERPWLKEGAELEVADPPEYYASKGHPESPACWIHPRIGVGVVYLLGESIAAWRPRAKR
jgi:hypothetical protein